MKVHYCKLRLLAKKERPPMKKETTSKCKELKLKTSDEKMATLKYKGLKKKDIR
jgi:hypothetical protein